MNNRVMIAATGSGSGKTSTVCGLIKAFLNRGVTVTSYKCGPDYIDPLFHKSMLEVDSYNLDIFLSGEEALKELLAEKSALTEISIIEGVMGFYDGILGKDFKGSSYDISNMTQTPVVLVINCRGKSASVVAEIKGFIELAPNLVKGVILNQVNEHMFSYYKEMITQFLDIEVLGYLPRNDAFSIDERRLGLCVEDREIIEEKMELLGKTIEKTVDLQKLVALAQSAPPLTNTKKKIDKHYGVRVGVASDEAFLFGYSYNTQLLENLGVSLVPFSPLRDKKLPDDIHGVLIGSGYISDYVQELSENSRFLTHLKEELSKGLPAIVEGEGNILLCEKYTDKKQEYDFTGINHTKITQVEKKEFFGYHYMRANKDNLLCKEGEIIPVHEFHYMHLENPGDGFTVYKPNKNTQRNAVFSSQTLYSGLPYLYFCGNEGVAENFVRACNRFKEEK